MNGDLQKKIQGHLKEAEKAQGEMLELITRSKKAGIELPDQEAAARDITRKIERLRRAFG